jgi:hypothetical protein
MFGKHIPLALDELLLEDDDEELVDPLDDTMLLVCGPPPMPALKSPTTAMHAVPESVQAKAVMGTETRLTGGSPPTR